MRAVNFGTCLLASVLALSACTAARVAAPKAPPPPQVLPPAATASTSRPATVKVKPKPSGLYTPGEALEDVMQGRWEYLGTGSWPGNNRTDACVFRNDRVIIVNVYCTATETPAFRVEILSPERGRLRLYAEADGGVSRRQRPGYFTFMVESEPTPEAAAPVLPLRLTMTLSELRLREAQRYEAFLPSCYNGVQHGRRQGGCLDALASREDLFQAETASFVDQVSPNWYQLVRVLRGLSAKYGRDPR